MTWALVTGGALRLGAHLCEGLAMAGYDVMIHYRSSRASAESLAQRLNGMGRQTRLLQGDFSSEEGIAQFVSSLNGAEEVSVLINNVGAYLTQSAEDTTLQAWQQLFFSNFMAPVALVQTLLPSLRAQRGSIINIGVAGIGVMRTIAHAPAYSTTKAALLAWTRALARELAPSHVRVNMVSPGQLEESQDLQDRPPQLPMGRPAFYQEVVNTVLFLLDQKSEYVTGQNVEIAGGYAL